MASREGSAIVACAAVFAAAFMFAAPSFAATVAPVSDRNPLEDVYEMRADLRKAFRPDDWTAIPGVVAARGIVDLEDWARRYGHKEYPELLRKYAPASAAAIVAPAANQPLPQIKKGSVFNFKSLSARSILVIDAPTGDILLARNSLAPWPIASITKLATAMVALDRGMAVSAPLTLTKGDEVGGARLRLETGTIITAGDAFNAMLVGSANNAASALARSTGLTPAEFVAAMNAKAKSLGLSKTAFTDPTGLDVGNVSTAREIAAMARAAFDGYYDIRKTASTVSYDIPLSDDQFHSIKNTNQLLTNEKNGLTVLAGKTGYLNESGWNLVVKVQDRREKPVIAVIFGGSSMSSLFRDTERSVKWVWDNYQWK